MKTIIHKADSRGRSFHGWLDSRHTFSFAEYFDPARVRFGMLRVINDDAVIGGAGFGTHPHENMEIISIPLEGDLEHKDSTGKHGIIRYGDVQVMSAGRGVRHSEYNASADKPVKFLQIWVFPNKQGVEPRYRQQSFNFREVTNSLQQILSPDPFDEGVWIYQNAWFSIGTFNKDHNFKYHLHDENNGVYAFVIEGGFEVSSLTLTKRDGLGISETDSIEINSLADKSVILLMEVPME